MKSSIKFKLKKVEMNFFFPSKNFESKQEQAEASSILFDSQPLQSLSKTVMQSKSIIRPLQEISIKTLLEKKKTKTTK